MDQKKSSPSVSFFQKLSKDFLQEIKVRFSEESWNQKEEDLAAYGRDWTTIFKPKPSAVFFPRSTQDVSDFLKLCTKHRVSVVPSGGRTGLSGGSVAQNGEVVLSLEKMREIGKIDPIAGTVEVQAGAVTQAVHDAARQEELFWPVDFGSKGSSQVGGNISTNAGGVRVVRYGSTRNWVLGLTVVKMSGEVLHLNGALEKNNCGPDFRHLIIGSEGTLAVVTEATLKLTSLPKSPRVFFFRVKNLQSAQSLFLDAKRRFLLSAFEFIDSRCLEAVRKVRNLRMPLTESTTSDSEGEYVLMELDHPETQTSQAELDQWLENQFENETILDGTLAGSSQESSEIWSLREGITESLGHIGQIYKNDIAVPLSRLNDFISELRQNWANASDGDLYLFGHLGDGNLHVNWMRPKEMSTENFVEICKKRDQEIFQMIDRYRGSVSAEHGIGLLKKHALAYSRSKEDIEMMRLTKKAWDPLGLLNPGKIIDIVDPALP